MTEDNGKKKTSRKRRNYSQEISHLTSYCKVNVEVLNDTAPEDPRSQGKVAAFNQVLKILGVL